MRPIQIIETMPITADDIRWIKRVVSPYSLERQNELLVGYIDRFTVAYERHPCEVSKGNAAAFIANTWIRQQYNGIEQVIVKNCTTCEWLTPAGICAFYNAPPPPEFLSVQKQECQEWLLEVPF